MTAAFTIVFWFDIVSAGMLVLITSPEEWSTAAYKQVVSTTPAQTAALGSRCGTAGGFGLRFDSFRVMPQLLTGRVSITSVAGRWDVTRSGQLCFDLGRVVDHQLLC